jgi:hypothetical protein
MVCVGSPDRIHQLGKLTLRDGPLGPLPHSALNKFPNFAQGLRHASDDPVQVGTTFAAYSLYTLDGLDDFTEEEILARAAWTA